MSFRKSVSALCLSGGLLIAQAQGDAKTEVEAAVQEFMKTLNSADWPAFRKCWTEQPILFNPSFPPERIDDPAAFDALWQHTFEGIRKGAAARGVTGGPYMRLTADELRIDLLSADVALATFHLTAPAGVGRRTMVLIKTPPGWKIAHLHASNLPKSASQ